MRRVSSAVVLSVIVVMLACKRSKPEPDPEPAPATSRSTSQSPTTSTVPSCKGDLWLLVCPGIGGPPSPYESRTACLEDADALPAGCRCPCCDDYLLGNEAACDAMRKRL